MSWRNDPATDAQRDYILSLAEKVELEPLDRTRLLAKVQTMTKDDASRTIEWLKGQPLRARTEARRATTYTWPTIHEGFYAVTDPKDGVLKFYRVDKPTEGRWTGYVFLKVQASDELFPIRDMEHRDSILKVIEADPQKAMLEYGLRIGRCGHCNRTLTDAESRARGIGPICAKAMKWA